MAVVPGKSAKAAQHRRSGIVRLPREQNWFSHTSAAW
jgi:hypothetical protein